MGEVKHLVLDQGQVEREIMSIFQRQATHLDKLIVELADFSLKTPDMDFYRAILYLLTHLEFSEQEALAHWQAICVHYRQLCTTTKRSMDIRVAILDYFLDVTKKINQPKIIEMKVFQTAQSQLVRDEMTGLFNYRHFKEVMAVEHRRAIANNDYLSLILIDIDNFKLVNDTYGHMAGDVVLREVAKRMEASLAQRDPLYRYGGEEFAVIVPREPKSDVRKIAEALRSSIAETPIHIEKDLMGKAIELPVTASFGIANIPSDAVESDTLIQRADKALYVAKASGKNTVKLYSDNMRHHQRRQYRTKMTIDRMQEEKIEIETLDISEGGMQFSTNAEIRADELFKIPFGDASKKRIFYCQAVQVRKDDSRFGVTVGVRFVNFGREDRDFIRNYLEGAI